MQPDVEVHLALHVKRVQAAFELLASVVPKLLDTDGVEPPHPPVHTSVGVWSTTWDDLHL